MIRFATYELTFLHAGLPLLVFPQVVALDYSRQGITSVRARLLSGVLRANGTLTSLDLYRQAS